MQTLYIFCLLWSVVVLAADEKETSPTEASTLNGLQCPTCHSLTSGTCEDKPDFCHGEEKLCVDSTGNVQNEGKEPSAFVTKGCVTPLALQALLGVENVKAGTTYTLTSVTVKEAQVESTGTPTDGGSNSPPISSEKPEDNSPPVKPTEAATEKTTSKGSPHISSGLSFALWLPIMSSVLWMTILS